MWFWNGLRRYTTITWNRTDLIQESQPILGVLVSHYHGDHYGRINEVLPEIPVYMSNQARSIIETVFSFTRKGKITHPTIDIRDQEPFYIKEVKITPYTVDHSAYRSLYVPNRGRQ